MPGVRKLESPTVMPDPKKRRSSERTLALKLTKIPYPKKRMTRGLRRTKQAKLKSGSPLSSLGSNSHSKELLMEQQNKRIYWEVLVSESQSSNSCPKVNIDLDQLIREMTDNSYESLLCSLITAKLIQEEDTVIVDGSQVSTEEHMSSVNLKANIYEFFQILRQNALGIRYCSSGEIGVIDVDDQKNRNVKISANVVGCHLEATVPEAEVDRIRKQHSYSSDAGGAEVIAQCLEKELSDTVDLASLSACGYSGDDEETHTLKRDHPKKVYRKKFGSYPTYRMRVNGVRWRTVGSSDDEADDENSFQETYRGSRRQKKAVNRYLNKHRSLWSSCDEGNSDDSGRDLVAVHTVFTNKKLVKKRPKQDEEVDTTASDASDTQSLTD